MKKNLLVIIILALAFTSYGQKTYKLQFKPKAGEKYDAITVAKSSIKQSMMGQEMVIDMDYNINMLYDVVQAAANTSVNLTYDKLEMKMAMMGQDMTMSSEDADTTNPGSKSFRAIKGSTVSVVVAPNGEIKEIKGADALWDKLADASPAEKETLKGIVSEENIKSTMESSLKMFPDKPVKVGESWTTTTTIESPYKLTSSNTYKLLKVENGTAFVNVVGKVTTGGAQTMSSNGMEMQVDLSGDQTGTLQLDEATGTVKKSNIVQTLKGKMEVMGQQVPMEVRSDVTVQMKKK